MDLGELEILSNIIRVLKRIHHQLNNFNAHSTNIDVLTDKQQKRVAQLIDSVNKLMKGINKTCRSYIIPFWHINMELSELILLNKIHNWPDNLEILERSQNQWPKDSEMQHGQYNLQLNAYHIIQGIISSNNYDKSTMNKVKNEWPQDYEMQLYCYNHGL